MAIDLQRIVHVNNNCTDLARSLAFFENVVGLKRTIHTAPERPQPGEAFGLDEAQWDAWILGAMDGGIALDLLQWLRPPPAPVAPRAANHVGLSRLGVSVPDVASRDGAAEVKVGPYAGAAVVLRDPDETLVELVAGDGPRTRFVGVNVTDLDRSLTFYENVVGLTTFDRVDVSGHDGAVYGLDGPCAWRSAWLTDARGGDAVAVELRQWMEPRPAGQPNRRANGVGYFRLAFYVADCAPAHETLVSLGVPCTSPPRDLDLGPGVGSCSALLFDDPDGAVLELIGPASGS